MSTILPEPGSAMPQAGTVSRCTSRRNLVIRSGALGDFILSLPLLERLSAEPAELYLATRDSYREVISPACRIAGVIDIDGPAGAALFGAAGEGAGRLDTLAGARVYAFVREDRELAAAWTAAGVTSIAWIEPHPTAPPHVAERFLRAAGFPVSHNLVETPLWPRSCPGDCLWVHPGSGSPSKNCPAAHFAAFARGWQNSHPGQAVRVSFGEADDALIAPTMDAMADAGVGVEQVDDLDLGALRRRLAREPQLYVGNDSGVTHLAAALGVPTIAFFRSTDPRVWRPLGHCEVRSFG